jgi:hypothetical protein
MFVTVMAIPALTFAAGGHTVSTASQPMKHGETKRRASLTESGAAVESEPSDPEENRSLNDERNIVGLERENVGAKASALACEKG